LPNPKEIPLFKEPRPIKPLAEIEKPAISALWMLLASLAFASMGVFIKLGSSQFSVAETVFYRSIVALVFMQLYVNRNGLSLKTPHWRAQLFRSGIGCIAMMTYFTAISLIHLDTAVMLNYTSPLFIALILRHWFREPATRYDSALLLMGFLGVALLLQPAWGSQPPAGLLTGLMAGFLFSLAGLGVRQLGKLGEAEWRTVYFFSLTCSLGGLVWVLAGSGFHAVDIRGFWLILGMGASGLVAQNAMTCAFKRGKTLLVANLQYTTVMFASLFGFLLWGEHLSLMAWVGAILIISSNVLMSVIPMLIKRMRGANNMPSLVTHEADIS
jgi:drug/metabolite transporter (DMT)-like permease